MKFSSWFAITLVGLALGLGACASSEPQSTASPSPAASSPAPAASAPASAPASPSDTTVTSTTTAANHDTTVSQGGQVVETGPYHLELVTLEEASGIHLDFYLQDGETHAAIPDATVRGQIQLPDGAQKAVTFEYDAAGQHYAATLPDTAAGEYKIAILTDIGGEKVNGRFSFNR